MVRVACAHLRVGMGQHGPPVIEVMALILIVSLTVGGMGFVWLVVIRIVMLLWVHGVVALPVALVGVLRQVVDRLLVTIRTLHG